VQIRPQFFLVIVVTDRHKDTHTQTNAGENIFPRFRGITKSLKKQKFLFFCQNGAKNYFRFWISLHISVLILDLVENAKKSCKFVRTLFFTDLGSKFTNSKNDANELHE